MRSESIALSQRPLTLAICLGMALLLASCSANAGTPPRTITTLPTPTATVPAATPTPPPQTVTTYTCATGSLPVVQGLTRTSCAVSTQGNYQVLRASYTGKTNSYFVDEPRLQSDGWVLIQSERGDSPNGAIGETIYAGAGDWFAFHYSYPASSLSIEQGTPINPQAGGSCGQRIDAASAERQGIPLPPNSLTTDDGTYIIVPFCLDDLQAFYSTALAATGWTITQPFQKLNTSPPLVISSAVVSHGSTYMQIALASGGGTPTVITIASSPPL